MASSPLRTACSGWLLLACCKAWRMNLRSSSQSSTNRMVRPSFINSARGTQLKPQTAALAGNGFHAHPAAHALDPFLDNGQPDARALVLLSLQPGEEAEDLALMAGGDAGAVVFHPNANELRL